MCVCVMCAIKCILSESASILCFLLWRPSVHCVSVQPKSLHLQLFPIEKYFSQLLI